MSYISKEILDKGNIIIETVDRLKFNPTVSISYSLTKEITSIQDCDSFNGYEEYTSYVCYLTYDFGMEDKYIFNNKPSIETIRSKIEFDIKESFPIIGKIKEFKHWALHGILKDSLTI